MLLRMLFMFDYACTGGSRAIIQLLRNAATPVRADADVRVREAWFVSVHGTSVRCSLLTVRFIACRSDPLRGRTEAVETARVPASGQRRGTVRSWKLYLTLLLSRKRSACICCCAAVLNF